MLFQNQVLTLEVDMPGAPQLVVARLRGEERMSGLFRFELDLLCDNPEIDLEAVLYAQAKLGIKVMTRTASGTIATATREIGGVFEEFEQLEQGQGMAKYQAILVPKVWQATRSYRSRIFMGKTIEGLVRSVLGKEEIKYDPAPDAPSVLDRNLDYDFKLIRQGDDPETTAEGDREIPRSIYPPREYVVQYEESDWAFLARWLEHEGIYFYFHNEDGDEKLVFADTDSGYEKSLFSGTFPYRPESAGDGADSDRFTEEEVRSFRCKQRRLPKQVSVNDYNWRVPSARLHFTEDVRENGTGMQTEYNDHFKNEKQGKALAVVRKEELACRAKVFYGTGSCRSFRPGQTFTLDGHFRDDYNRSFVLTRVVHEAEQMISVETSSVTGVKYENTFEAIPDDVPWRPERVTEWPAIKGVMHAKVDSAGDGKYADLDPDGRYLLKMPYDEHSDVTPDGEASRWVRMAQPYAGANAGMHFPLLKGAEVLVTHIDGDPDRPVISGAVPNPETESPSTGANNTKNQIKTASGSAMEIDDRDGARGFYFHDATSSYISDRRWHTKTAPATSSSGSPGSGNGSALGDTPASGSGMTQSGTSKVSGWENLENDGDDASLGLQQAWNAFVTGDALRAISTSGKYQSGGNTGAAGLSLSTWNDNTGYDNFFQSIATDHANIAESDASTNIGAATGSTDTTDNSDVTALDATGLGAVLERLVLLTNNLSRTGKVDNNDLKAMNFGGTSATAVFDSIHNFTGEAYGSRLRTWVGDDLFIKVGDKYTYNDITRDVAIGTGGLGWKEEHGDTEDHNFHYGKAVSYSIHYGDTSSESRSHGDVDSKSYTIGNDTSHSTSMSTLVSTDIVCSTHTTNGLTVGACNSNSVQIGAKGGLDMFIGAELNLNITLGGKLDINIGAVKEGTIDLCLTYDIKCLPDTSIAISKQEAALNKTAAKLMGTEGALQKNHNYVSEMANKIAWVDTTATLTETRLAAAETTLALRRMFGTEDEIAAAKSEVTALTTIQALLLMVG